VLFYLFHENLTLNRQNLINITDANSNIEIYGCITVMFNRYCKPNQNIKLDGIALEAVSKTLYLGQITVMLPDKEIEIQRRIALSWQAFGWANLIFSSRLPLSLKRKVYDQCVLPTLTYGAETQNLTKKQVIKLRTTQWLQEWKILGITWKDIKTAKWIRKQTKLQIIIGTIKKLK